jgi:formylglycine-generating enzyme required for sulfatase activity
MLFPTISEYKAAVRNALKTLRTLKDYEPVLRPDGEPLFYSGGLAAVFKLKHRETGKFLALKCFHKDQENREARYKLISECLIDYPSNYLVHYDYKDNEIFVNSSVAGNRGYPVLALEWAEGLTMGEFVSQCCHKRNEAALNKLVDEFNWFAFWLLSQPFAHGDLKPDNIIIRPDGSPVLLDYDGMYVPAMEGQDASEQGSPVYRHPARTIMDFNKRIDDFSLIVLMLELRILAANPQAVRNSGESLFFRQEDISLSALPKLASLLELNETSLSGHLLQQMEEALKQKEMTSTSLSPLLFRHLKREPLPSWKPVTAKAGHYLEPDMVFIQGGTYEMGDVFNDSKINFEKPVHKVTLSDYYLAKTTVTFEEYDLYCKATGIEKPGDKGWGRDKRPVINVSWFDAVRYCNWLSEQAGLQKVYSIKGETITADWHANGYRLPTEAEWEYAARQRGQKTRFGNGKNIADPAEINFNGSPAYQKFFSTAGIYREQTVPVGTLPANNLGLHEMSGNVYEWCWDWYEAYSSVFQLNPLGPDTGSVRVLRGGSYKSYPEGCRVSSRVYTAQVNLTFILGFRLARTP